MGLAGVHAPLKVVSPREGREVESRQKDMLRVGHVEGGKFQPEGSQ